MHMWVGEVQAWIRVGKALSPQADSGKRISPCNTESCSSTTANPGVPGSLEVGECRGAVQSWML